MLQIKNLHVAVEDKEILIRINLINFKVIKHEIIRKII